MTSPRPATARQMGGSAGGAPRPITDADLAGLLDLGGGFNVDTMWLHLARRTDLDMRPPR